MKTFAISLISTFCALAALALPQTSKAQLVFQTTFNCPDWDQRMPGGEANVCNPNDGISNYGGWIVSTGSADQITAAANNPNGGGGKGFRHWRGNGANGVNDNGGGIRISLPSSYSELWVRVYMRFQAGFHWAFPPDNHPHYTKDFYWHAGQSNSFVFGYQGGAWGLYSVGGVAYPSSVDWKTSQGNSTTGDGLFHCYEYHVKQNGTNGLIEIWFDGARVLSVTGVNHGSVPWDWFALGENQSQVTDSAGNVNTTPTIAWYTDYDDLAISATGRIGCIGSTPLPAPANLRVQ